jgi:hypothetical protein
MARRLVYTSFFYTRGQKQQQAMKNLGETKSPTSTKVKA